MCKMYQKNSEGNYLWKINRKVYIRVDHISFFNADYIIPFQLILQNKSGKILFTCLFSNNYNEKVVGGDSNTNELQFFTFPNRSSIQTAPISI